MNDNLILAKRAKNDEFYTQLSDIEKELEHYPEDTFKDKVVYCPCDVGVDGLSIPKSNFVKYFEDNKERLGYKRLLHTSLQEGYDFHSDYCTNLLKEADIVVTNPPFSLFRDFFKWLMDNDKKFIILGNKNAITYKDVFPYIRDNKVWLGYSIHSGERYFYQPEINGLSKGIGVRWFTNLDTSERHDNIILTKKYEDNESCYPKYDNYDAIEVGKTCDIPYDYDGVMGVPITFLDKYNPDQFEIIGHPQSGILPDGWQGVKQSFVDLYFSQGNNGQIKEGWVNPVYIKDGKAIVPYQRLLIRRRANS